MKFWATIGILLSTLAWNTFAQTSPAPAAPASPGAAAPAPSPPAGPALGQRLMPPPGRWCPHSGRATERFSKPQPARS